MKAEAAKIQLEAAAAASALKRRPNKSKVEHQERSIEKDALLLLLIRA